MSKHVWIASLVALTLAAGCSHEQAKPEPKAKESSRKEARPAEATAATPASDKTSKAITAAIDAWASAWEKQKVDAYLAAYAPSFKPEKGSRKTWEKQRRERVSAPKKIKVTIGNPVVTVSKPDKATAKFVQVYESDTLNDQTRKTLDFQNVDGKWLITRERAD